MKELQGKWFVSALEVNGTSMPPSGSIAIDGGHFESHGMGSVYRGEVTFDTTRTPHGIRLTFTEGPEKKGNVNHGIFELTKGGWRLCINMTGGAEPTGFKTTSGSGAALEMLTREQPLPTGVREPALNPRTTGTYDLDGAWSMQQCVINGEAMPSQIVSSGKRVADGKRITVTIGGGAVVDATYTVDRRVSPMTIDYRLADGRTQRGVWRLEGTLLTVNFSAPGAARPEGFESRAGNQCTMTVWQKD